MRISRKWEKRKGRINVKELKKVTIERRNKYSAYSDKVIKTLTKNNRELSTTEESERHNKETRKKEETLKVSAM